MFDVPGLGSPVYVEKKYKYKKAFHLNPSFVVVLLALSISTLIALANSAHGIYLAHGNGTSHPNILAANTQ